MLELDVLVFDIDGVLIDVSESYRRAIRATAQLYLESALGLAAYNGELVSREDVAALKLAGGLNNDWDLTAAILKYFTSLFEVSPVPVELPKTTPAVLEYLHRAGKGLRVGVEDLARRKDIRNLAGEVAAEGGGLAGVRKVLGERNGHLVFASGDPRETNLVKRIFEEVYLGDEYFTGEYGEPPAVYHGPGLIRNEQRIVSPEALEKLAGQVPMGVATGRPRNQAVYALETAGILHHFRSLVVHEDVVAAEQQVREETGQAPDAQVHRGKPHPFTLLEAVHRILPGRVRGAYIGDTLDDIRAANAAKEEMDFVSIACLAPAEDKAMMRFEFERAGADLILEHPDELVDQVKKRAGG